MSAIISDCGKYRYLLTRRTNCPLRWIRKCLFIMLNPSTADAEKNDPTIRKCIKFAEKFGCTDLTVVNLFAFRATNPLEIKMDSLEYIGPDNDQIINEQIDLHQGRSLIISAWGTHKIAKARGREMLFYTGEINCLGRNKDGSPKHPLYIPYTKELERINSMMLVNKQ